MITREEAQRLRGELLAVLTEDARNTERLLARLDSLTRETGIGAHAALLLILTRLAFDEEEARRHWQAILAHRDVMEAALGRDCGLRVAVLDYFVNVNRRLVRPALIDLAMTESAEGEEIDALTGAASSQRFRRALQVELRRARRYELEAAVALFDVDDFAAVAERVGPLVADRVLRELAIVLHNVIRDIDVVARPGEDELAVLLPETGRNGALLVAERFRREAEAFFARRELGAGAPPLTVSGGVACYPADATAPETLLERAAQALYRAKASGKNAIQLYDPERRRFLRFELEPGRFEVEVLAPPDRRPGRARNLSRNGILFASPEALEVGETIEIRLVDGALQGVRPLRIRGQVVRLEELPEDCPAVPGADRYEVGVAFDLDWSEGSDDLLEFLERAQGQGLGRSS